MATYRLINDLVTGDPIGVRREADGANIPDDPANRDWVEYLAWVDAGNTPDPPANKAKAPDHEKRKGLFR